ncbi:MAG: V-type ATP synthase subunit I [Oscillospiraceae bacterium]
MKRLRLLAIKSQKDELLRQLLLMGCVEVTEPGKEELGTTLKHETSNLAKCRDEFRDLTTALGLLDKYASLKDGMFTLRPEFEQKMLIDDSGEEVQLKLAYRIIELDEKIKRLSSEEINQQNIMESLKPWLSMDMPLDYNGTRSTGVVFGGVPAAVDLGELKQALSAAAGESAMFEISSDKEQHCISVLFHISCRETVMETLRSFWFSQMALTGLSGTARENTDSANQKLTAMAEEKKALAEQIAAEKPRRNELKLAIDHMAIRISEEEATDRLMSTPSTIVMEGWIPAVQEKKLVEKLKNFDCAWETRAPTKEETAEVPVLLKDGPLASPFSSITEMYSLPSYDGIDPNVWLLPFFSVFFGIMFADMGYGILVMLGGLFIKRKMHPRGSMKQMSDVAIMCGLTSFVFGAITGTFFGDAITVVAGMYGKDIELPYVISALDDPLVVLIGSMVLGVIHLSLGLCLNAYMLIRDGHWVDALCDVGSLFLLFIGVAVGALGVTWWVAIAGVIAIVATQGRSSPSIGGKIGGGLWALYSTVSGYFGDVLSYSRIMALMLASSVIASVFNTLGSMAGNIFIFAIVFIIGHSLNIALSLISAFVHTSRLMYLEFFGKFYRDGGRAFQPLKVKTNYVDIIKED